MHVLGEVSLLSPGTTDHGWRCGSTEEDCAMGSLINDECNAMLEYSHLREVHASSAPIDTTCSDTV